MAADQGEHRAIEKTVRDYFEGWFEGDAVRMKRALHPELVKRSFIEDQSGRLVLRTVTAKAMIEATARGEGKAKAPPDARIEVEVEHVLGHLASVTVRSAVYMEYLHLVRTPQGWRIVNDVWQPTPSGSEP